MEGSEEPRSYEKGDLLYGNLVRRFSFLFSFRRTGEGEGVFI